jgi:hypothetical protein
MPSSTSPCATTGEAYVSSLRRVEQMLRRHSSRPGRAAKAAATQLPLTANTRCRAIAIEPMTPRGPP